MLSAKERQFLSACGRLAYANPFLEERTTLEREALGKQFHPSEPLWSVDVADPAQLRVNAWRVHSLLDPLIETLATRFAQRHPGPTDIVIYEEAVHHTLYQRYFPQLWHNYSHPTQPDWTFYTSFAADCQRLLSFTGIETRDQAPHLLACFWQIMRAFHLIYDRIIGSSIEAARLRASIWQSIFTRDMRRYRRHLYARMADFPTLITGPSGTGKELVARAIAGSRYIPFDAQRRRFAANPLDSFYPINLAALPATLIESELFGHRKGSFTGAIADRKGYLESCTTHGTVFLDELAEMDRSIQVKLLRVLETREFTPLGDTRSLTFPGKLIAATNRDLSRDIAESHFRSDLYYRLCADLIRTPSLAGQLTASTKDAPRIFEELVLHMLRRILGESAHLALPEVLHWIRHHLPRNYTWPGNYRELDQCVRNILIRGEYRPLDATPTTPPLWQDYDAGRLSADQLLAAYCRHVFSQTSSYEETARRIGLDRRTVKAKILSLA